MIAFIVLFGDVCTKKCTLLSIHLRQKSEYRDSRYENRFQKRILGQDSELWDLVEKMDELRRKEI